MSQVGHIITKIEYGDRDINNWYLLDDLNVWDVENGNPYYEIEKIENLIINFNYTELYKRINFWWNNNRRKYDRDHEQTVNEIYEYVDDLLYMRDYIKEHGDITLEVW